MAAIGAAAFADARFFHGTAEAAVNQAPTVVIAGPQNASRYDAPADIVLQATASDDAGVARVDFYADGTLVGSDTSAPYEFVWTGVPAGIHQAVAVATDTDGVQSSSTPVNIGVKPLPGRFNIARNQQVFSSSSIDGAHGPANAVDGNESTGWVSAAGDGRWIYVDLGTTTYVSHFTITWGANYATKYSIQYSANPAFEQNWGALYTNDAGDGGVDDLVSSPYGFGSFRYLRVLCTETVASNGCGINEFEISREGYDPSTAAHHAGADQPHRWLGIGSAPIQRSIGRAEASTLDLYSAPPIRRRCSPATC